jgi:hypothetical protein
LRWGDDVPQLIPTRSDLSLYDLQVVLEDVQYTLQFRLNVRMGAWFMSVLDGEGVVPIMTGARIVVNWPLWAYFTGRDPAGAFVAVDTASTGADPGPDDMGARVQLVYYSSEELGL